MSRIRDFLYMDVDRVKSTLAQLDRGLVETVSNTGQRSKQVGASAHGKIAAVVGLSGETEFLWSNEETETRTLHDHIYNLVEESLLQAESLIRVPGSLTEEEVTMGALQQSLGETSMVLMTGYPVINDFARLDEFFKRFNDIAKFIAYCSTQESEGSKADRSRIRQEAAAKLSLPKEFLSGFEVIFDVFYKERTVVKLRPLADNPMGTLAGVLRPEFLREPVDVIVYKYGLAPATPWHMLAQVSAIPMEDEISLPVPRTGGDIEQSVMAVFDSMREVQTKVQAVVYPEIAVTPIAIYRE